MAKVKQFKKTLIVFSVLFALYSLTLLYPFVWMVFNSFKTKANFLYHPMSFGGPWNPRNYIDVFSQENFNLPTMFLNSIVLVAGQTIAGIFVSCCTAYVVARYKFVGKNVIYFLSIAVMLIPTTGSLVALYPFMNDTQLIDTYYGMIILSAGGFGFNFLIIYGFFKNISSAYSEAAAIDGAGHFRIFLKIMLPQCMPVLVALSVVAAIGIWNDYYNQLLFFSGHPTVAVGIQTLSEDIVEIGKDYPLFFAAVIVTTLPVIILYAAFQKKIVENTTVGGLKG